MSPKYYDILRKNSLIEKKFSKKLLLRKSKLIKKCKLPNLMLPLTINIYGKKFLENHNLIK